MGALGWFAPLGGGSLGGWDHSCREDPLCGRAFISSYALLTPMHVMNTLLNNIHVPRPMSTFSAISGISVDSDGRTRDSRLAHEVCQRVRVRVALRRTAHGTQPLRIGWLNSNWWPN